VIKLLLLFVSNNSIPSYSTPQVNFDISSVSETALMTSGLTTCVALGPHFRKTSWENLGKISHLRTIFVDM